MSTLSVRLPETLHKQIRKLAKEEGISINQFITLAATEKISALLTVDYLKARAKRGDRGKFEAILAGVPGRKPLPGDEI